MDHSITALFDHTAIEQEFKYSLLKNGKKQILTPNKTILSPSISSPNIGFITKGILKVTLEVSEKPVFLFYLNAKNNFIINDINITLNTPVLTSYTTVTDAEVYWVPKQLIDKWYVIYPEFKNVYFYTMKHNINSVLANLVFLNSIRLKDRLFNFLRESSLQLEAETFKVFNYTLANDLNTSVQSISRAMSLLEKESKIKRNNKNITICSYF